MGPGKQRGTLGLVWRNRKKFSQIINDYLLLTVLPLLIILCFLPCCSELIEGKSLETVN
jgi:hypothetical protein